MAELDWHPMAAQALRDRKAAIWTGIFFIIATAFLFLGEAIYKPVLEAPDAMREIAANRPRAILGILVEFLCVIAMPMIAVAIYPVLRRWNESVALAYVVFRFLEAVVIIVVAQINKLAVIALSDAVQSGGVSTDAAVAILDGYAARTYWGDTAGPLYNIVFVIGALILYIALFRSRLAPRWIAVSGIVAILMLAGGVLGSLFVEVTGIWVWILVLPIAVQEMVMALWFIFRGFDAQALESLPPA